MKLIVDNLAVEYYDQGKGPVLLLLHGWGDTSQTFDAINQALVDDFRVIRLDLPGFGGSEISESTWDISRYVEFVGKFCMKLEIVPMAIIGHSFGGRIAIRGLSTGSLKSEKLILIGSAGIAKTMTLRNTIIMFATKLFGFITYIPPLLFYRDKIRRRFYQMIGSDYIDSGSMKETYLEIIHEDLQVFASEIHIPTLLIWGEKDTATPLSDGRRLSELIKGSRLEVIKGASHFVHQEDSEQVAQLIKGFMK